jgi:hypothetical protein
MSMTKPVADGAYIEPGCDQPSEFSEAGLLKFPLRDDGSSGCELWSIYGMPRQWLLILGACPPK